MRFFIYILVFKYNILLFSRQESLVLQISEKDSIIALLERFRGNQSEIMKLKKEKEKLIHQLKIQVSNKF